MEFKAVSTREGFPGRPKETARSYTSITDPRYKFTEKERDVETGYDYFGARYYDSRIWRWLAVDPLAEKYPGTSPYSYALGNPISSVDPDGRMVIGTRTVSRPSSADMKLSFTLGLASIIPHPLAILPAYGAAAWKIGSGDPAMQFGGKEAAMMWAGNYIGNKMSGLAKFGPDLSAQLQIAGTMSTIGMFVSAGVSIADVASMGPAALEDYSQMRTFYHLLNDNDETYGIPLAVMGKRTIVRSAYRGYRDECTYETETVDDPFNLQMNPELVMMMESRGHSAEEIGSYWRREVGKKATQYNAKFENIYEDE